MGSEHEVTIKPGRDTLLKDARLTMVHNFIHLTCVAEKSRYALRQIEPIFYTVLKKGKCFFFTSNTANSY